MNEAKLPRVICLDSQAYYALLDATVEHLNTKFSLPAEDIWVSGERAKELLNISSDTTLANLRALGKVRFSTAGKKNLVYDRRSIAEYLESNAKNKF